MCTGGFAAAVTTPLDVAKTRIMLAKVSGKIRYRTQQTLVSIRARAFMYIKWTKVAWYLCISSLTLPVESRVELPLHKALSTGVAVMAVFLTWFSSILCEQVGLVGLLAGNTVFRNSLFLLVTVLKLRELARFTPGSKVWSSELRSCLLSFHQMN